MSRPEPDRSAPAVASAAGGAPATRPPGGSDPVAALVLMAFATLAIGLLLAADPRWGYDEAWHLYLSTVSPWTKALEEGLVDAHPPLHHLLLMPMAALGPDPLWFRLPSVVAAAAAVPLWYLLLRRLRVGPDVALLGTLLLVTSAAFLELGVVVRSYSLGVLFLLLGLLGASSLVPAEASAAAAPARRLRPRPLTAALGLTIAFAFMYSTLFVTLALVIALGLIWARRAATRAWRLGEWMRDWRLADWLALSVMAIGTLLVLAWFAVGYGRGRGAVAPAHVDSLILRQSQSPLDFAWQGLVGNAAWLTPQFPQTPLWQAIAVAAFGVAALVVLLLALRERRRAALLLVLAAVVATGLVFGAGVAGVYPFGGLARHQAMLLPLYLGVIVLVIDAVWSRLPSQRARRALGLAVAAFALLGLYRAQTADPIGEGNTQGVWSGALSTLGTPCAGALYVESLAFYPLYADAYPRGIDFRMTLGVQDGRIAEVPYADRWLAGLGSSRGWDLFHRRAECGSAELLIRDRQHWTFPAIPDAPFLHRLKDLMDYLGIDSLQMLRVRPDGEAAPDAGSLRAPYREAGLLITQVRRLRGMDAWVVRIEAPLTGT